MAHDVIAKPGGRYSRQRRAGEGIEEMTRWHVSFLLNIWWLLVLIGVMILVHELGHFWAARAFDVKVEVFSFGFGPRLFGFRRGETDYRFSLFLFGGYVKMAGEQPGENRRCAAG